MPCAFQTGQQLRRGKARIDLHHGHVTKALSGALNHVEDCIERALSGNYVARPQPTIQPVASFGDQGDQQVVNLSIVVATFHSTFGWWLCTSMGTLSTYSVIDLSRLHCRSSLIPRYAISRTASRKILRFAGGHQGGEARQGRPRSKTQVLPIASVPLANCWPDETRDHGAEHHNGHFSPERRSAPRCGLTRQDMCDIDLTARVAQAPRHPRHDAASFQHLAQHHRTKLPNRSARLSTPNDSLKPGMTGCSVSPTPACGSACGFCAAV